MKSLWNDDDAARFEGRSRPAGLHLAPARAGPDLVLHGGGNTSVKIREPDLFGETRTCCTSRAAAGTWRRSRRRASRRCACARAPARAAGRALGHRDGPRAARGDRRPGGAGAVGRDDPARHPARPLRRPHPRRRAAQRSPTRPTASDAHARALRRLGRRRPVRDAGLRPGPALRAELPAELGPEHGRRGADEPRLLLVRRDGAASRTSA